MAETSIEWTDRVWNPTTGCDRISPGCDNCYALTLARRLKAMGQAKYQADGDPRTSGPGFALTVHPDTLGEPLRWRKPRRVFVNSMSDLFHPDVPDDFIHGVWAKMAVTPRHTYQVLTKRPQRMAAWMAKAVERWGSGPMCVLPNVWLGTSIETDRYTFRADHLRATPAAVRWLSLEPLLGPLPSLDLTGIDWAVVGGESGPGARPMHPDWARDIRDRCLDAGVPFFFKQRGAWTWDPPESLRSADGYVSTVGATRTTDADTAHESAPGEHRVWRIGKHEAGRELDGRTWDQMPEAVTRG